MADNHFQANKHLVWRAGFGIQPKLMDDFEKQAPKKTFQQMLKSSENGFVSIKTAPDALNEFFADGYKGVGKLNAEERRKLQRLNRDAIRDLNLAWLKQMVNSEAQLREKWALFWHGHFACRSVNIYHQELLLDVIRKNALGKFSTLLHEVSKTAAMLNFLNNQQNRKGHPNENFAREVMELFTLGRGNYTENDIKEAARSFTGWAATPKGEYSFRRALHDNGSKTVFGKTGNYSGEDILDMLLDNPQTAQYLVTKIYRFFVNEIPDKAHIEELSKSFYQSGYNIQKLSEKMFTSGWFYEPRNIGCKIKSPVELLVGIQRNLPMQLNNDEALLQLQRILGQVLFYPPNVAGWPGGQNWIDSSSLMARMRIPKMLADEDVLNVTPKDDDDQMMGIKENKKKQVPAKARGKGINVDIHWEPVVQVFEKVPRNTLLNEMSRYLLQKDSAMPQEAITGYINSADKASFIKSGTIILMCTPEYQMC